MKRIICLLLCLCMLLCAGCSTDKSKAPSEDAVDDTKKETVIDQKETVKNLLSFYRPTDLNEKYWGGGQFSFLEIDKITFLSSLDTMPEGAMDISRKDNGKVMSWVVSENASNHLYIAGEGGVWTEDQLGPSGGLFGNFQNAKSISFNNSVHTEDTWDMFGMFRGCTNLEQVDLSGIDTSSATSLKSMFAYCEKLKTLDLSSFDTTRVYNINSMFYDCYELERVDLSSFDFSKIQHAASLFEDCKKLTDICCEITIPENAQQEYMYENCPLGK